MLSPPLPPAEGALLPPAERGERGPALAVGGRGGREAGEGPGHRGDGGGGAGVALPPRSAHLQGNDRGSLAPTERRPPSGGEPAVFVLCVQLAEDCSLQPAGTVLMAGSRLCIAPQPHRTSGLWNITPDGLVRCYHNPQLVLEVKGEPRVALLLRSVCLGGGSGGSTCLTCVSPGGQHFDKNLVIINTLEEGKPSQRWTVEIM